MEGDARALQVQPEGTAENYPLGEVAELRRYSRFFHQVICDLEKKLGCVLFQLPPNLKKDAALLQAFLVDVPDGMRCAFEFRDPSWFDDTIFELLKTRNLALCIAESEKLATPIVATADYGYLRLRREDYQEADVARWAEW